MPITLNHSNIGVQYSTGSNYIIETVKSDLYRRNEIVDTIVRDNIQTAPVTPIISIQEGSNVYAVESYTYSGTANTADFTRVFPKSTTCDILIVGGGGGGGFAGSNARGGGGGGAGQFLLKSNYSLNAGKYNINVGRGGVGGNVTTENGETGKNSSITTESNTILLESSGGGGGARGKSGTISNGLNGASGGGGCGDDVANRCLGGTALIQFVNNNIVYTGYNGANGGLAFNGGGGGGYTSAGFSATTISGGDGGSGITNNITGVVINYCAGGGGGGYNNGVSTGTRGGNGGNITAGNGGNYPGANGGNATNGSGSGGGGAGVSVVGGPAYLGGNGGSGIVIIRYLLGTIPANNLLTNANEPIITSPTFTETIRTFVHSGGAEAQTTHTITVGRDTICDILVVGGGGGGGIGVNDMYEGGGGGAGGIVYMINKTLNAGTYKINVGKGGASNTNGNNSTITYSNDNNITFDNIQLIGRGGGKGAASAGGVGSDGGSGGGGCHPSTNGGLATQGNTFWNGTSYVAGGFNGGKAAANSRGAAGGGAGEIGETDGAGFGGDGRSVDISGVNTFYAGGGNSHPNSSTTRSDGGGGTLNGSLSYQNGGNALPNTGSGGAGAYSPGYSGGAGGSGIIIIKFKSLAGPILEGIAHKRLNFAFDSLGFSFDATKSVEYQAQLKTGVGGWRIVRYLPPNLGRWYQGDYISTSTFTIPTIGTPYNYTNEWAVSFGTFDEMIFGTFDMTYWLQCLKTSVLGTYDNGARPIIKSSERNYAHSINWYNRTGVSVDPFISINNHTATPNLIVYADNNSPDHSSLLNAYGGMCVLVRDSTSGTIIPNPNTYTLNFPVPTIADINNNSNIVLRGAYDIALSTSNALIIPKAGQYIPQPTTFTNYSVERMYPPVRNFSAATTTVSGQTYGNGTYVVSFSTSFDANLAPYTCFNTSQGSGGHWTAGYTAGNYNGSAFVVAGYLGDWLKIQLPVAIKLTRFEFLMRTDTQGIRERSPKNFKIYGSNDNITWVELVNKTDAVYDTSFRYIQLTQDITTAYTYYGLVVNKLLGSTADTLNFDEWYIYGQEVLPSSLSIRYNLLNPTQDPIGAQWTYNTSNMNVYNMGRVGIGTTNPEYQLDVSGSLNAKTLMYNGSSVNSLGLSVGMIAQVQHLTYTKMEVKDNTGWDAINEDLTSGFVIKITPKSSLSKMLVNIIVFIGMSTSTDNAWWGIKLYRKIGTGSWTEITGCNGTETGSAAATAGTPVWISNNTGMVTYNSSITNASGTYLDSPNTKATVYYTAYWNQRLGDNPSTTGQMFLNRASSQDDAYRPAPSSSWTVEEIWYG